MRRSDEQMLRWVKGRAVDFMGGSPTREEGNVNIDGRRGPWVRGEEVMRDSGKGPATSPPLASISDG